MFKPSNPTVLAATSECLSVHAKANQLQPLTHLLHRPFFRVRLGKMGRKEGGRRKYIAACCTENGMTCKKVHFRGPFYYNKCAYAPLCIIAGTQLDLWMHLQSKHMGCTQLYSTVHEGRHLDLWTHLQTISVQVHGWRVESSW